MFTIHKTTGARPWGITLVPSNDKERVFRSAEKRTWISSRTTDAFTTPQLLPPSVSHVPPYSCWTQRYHLNTLPQTCLRRAWACHSSIKKWLEHYINWTTSLGTQRFCNVSLLLSSVHLPPLSEPDNNHVSSPISKIPWLWLACQNSLQLMAKDIDSSLFSFSMPYSQGTSSVPSCPSSFERGSGHRMGTKKAEWSLCQSTPSIFSSTLLALVRTIGRDFLRVATASTPTRLNGL